MYNLYMPSNPKKLLYQTRFSEEELAHNRERYRLGLSSSKPPKRPNPNTKTGKLLTEVYDRFTEAAEAAGRIKHLKAVYFDDLKDGHSPMTLRKVKTLLGIRSIRKNNQWWWTYPRHAPTDALARIHSERVKDIDEADKALHILNWPVTVLLKEAMEKRNYCGANDDVLSEMLSFGYKRQTVLRAKAILGIVSRKVGQTWYWMWTPEQNCSWLRNFLSQGPQPHQLIRKAAEEEKKWQWEYMLVLRIATYGVEWRVWDGLGYWVDINNTDAPPVPQHVLEHEIEQITPVSQRRMITVDFTQDEQLTDEEDLTLGMDEIAPLPEEEIADDDSPESEIVKINGVKIEFFK